MCIRRKTIVWNGAPPALSRKARTIQEAKPGKDIRILKRTVSRRWSRSLSPISRSRRMFHLLLSMNPVAWAFRSLVVRSPGQVGSPHQLQIQDIWREAIANPFRSADLAYEILEEIVNLFNRDKQCRGLYLITDAWDNYQAAYNTLAKMEKLYTENMTHIRSRGNLTRLTKDN